jgi:hypothetical protein
MTRRTPTATNSPKPENSVFRCYQSPAHNFAWGFLFFVNKILELNDFNKNKTTIASSRFLFDAMPGIIRIDRLIFTNIPSNNV